MHKEVINAFLPIINDVRGIIDGTVGFGGHSSAFLSLHGIHPDTMLHAIDADRAMLQVAKERLDHYAHTVQYHNMFFDEYFKNNAQPHVDFILMDLGVSMYHFKESKRGFSRNGDEPLDMRLSHTTEQDASFVINNYSKDDLVSMLYEYGEERQAVKWVQRIVEARKVAPIKTVSQLCEVLQLGKKSIDRPILNRIFQAIRIEVNQELTRITRALPYAWECLRKKGRLAIISFHSLEDRIVKHFFKYLAGKNTEDEVNKYINMPIYNKKVYNTGALLTKKPIIPSEEELGENIASRSAKLRIIEKVT